MSATFGARVRARRLELDLSQTQLAQRIPGVSRDMVANVESERVASPRVDVVESFAAALAVSPCELVGWTDDHTRALLDDLRAWIDRRSS